MKLYLIPWPWDYHKQAGLVVMAVRPETALELAKEWYSKSESSWKGEPDWERISEVSGPVYENGGCDC